MSRTAAFCVLALIGFAANSLLTRLALRPRLIDAASFTLLRLVSGALVLVVLARIRRPAADLRYGNWTSALSLFGYVASFFWYAALPGLEALHAALVQLTVPVITALCAIVLLDEQPNARLVGSGLAVLGGVALALLSRSGRSLK